MSFLRNYLNKIKPNFEEGGKLHAFRSVFDGFETFLYVPNDTAKVGGVNIHDAIDSKRIMSMVVIALMPAMLFGMYNIGYQNYAAAGTLASASFFEIFIYGFLAVLPKILVSYIVGLGIEFAWAQWKGEEIQEGYLVSGIIIPLIIPIGCPLWMLALACAFSVIFCKEIFGGTGMNIFNPAVAARMFLFFAYPSKMTGDTVWVAQNSIFGLGNNLPDGFTAATPLGQLAQNITPDASILDMALGFIPGSIGETSLIAIAIGAFILLWTGIASWRTMLSVFVGGIAFALLFEQTGQGMTWWHHFVMGGFAFGAVFMATDPVTSCRTTTGQYIAQYLETFKERRYQMKLNTNSNAYIIIYSAILVVIVAFLLAFVYQALKPMQDANVALDVKKQILYSLNIRDLDGAEAEAKYAEVVKNEGEIDGQKYYACEINGEDILVVSLKGMGLWGGISGYISIHGDETPTVYGAYFNHESETAGLGAEIKDSQEWQEKFIGKKVFVDPADGSEVALGVVKNVDDPETQVDCVTGATLTSNGVNDMIKAGLKDAGKRFVQLFMKMECYKDAPADSTAVEEPKVEEE